MLYQVGGIVSETQIILLSERDLFKRWKGSKSIQTLRNWRSLGIGVKYIKVGHTPLYPLAEVIKYESQSIYK